MSESQGRAPQGTDGEPVTEAAARAADGPGSGSSGSSGSSGGSRSESAAAGGTEELQPLAVSTPRVVLWGELAWVVALVVILAVPSLHEGERDWWPWVPVAGIVLGLLGFAYVRRGRGNAAGAH